MGAIATPLCAWHSLPYMGTLADRLREAMADANINQSELARACRVKQPSVHGWLSGRAKFLRGENLLAAARVLGVNDEWLATGRGPKERGDTLSEVGHFHEAYTQGQPVSRSATAPGYIRIPRLTVEVGAGGGTMVETETDVVEMLEVADWWAQQNLPRDLSKVRVVTARGDSMAPDIKHGDVMFVDISSSRFEAPGLYVLVWQGRTLVKRLVPEMTGRRLALVSSNPAYPPEHIEEGDLESLHIAGRVAAWWTLRKY